MKNGLDPAHYVLTKLGGEEKVVEKTGIPIDTLWRWQRPFDPVRRGGTGGRIPQRRWDVLLDLARKEGISLSKAELAGAVQFGPLDKVG